jgi:hypothetical protein
MGSMAAKRRMGSGPDRVTDALADDGTDPSNRLVPLRRHYLS